LDIYIERYTHRPGHDGREFIFDETVDYSAPKLRGQANPSNLTERRWRDPILSAAEVADNLRAAKGPEPGAAAAKNVLAQAFHRLVLKEAKNHCDGVNNDDLIAAGMLGLAEAINRFDLRRNNGFTAYAKPLIRGRMQKTAKAFNRDSPRISSGNPCTWFLLCIRRSVPTSARSCSRPGRIPAYVLVPRCSRGHNRRRDHTPTGPSRFRLSKDRLKLVRQVGSAGR
jgi:sigma-70-like protein